MSASFLVADNLDGTVTVTIADAGSAPVVVYTSPVDTQWTPDPAWASRGTRTGSGTVTFALPAGVYFVAVTTSGAWLAPQTAQIVGDTVAQCERLLQALEARVRLMTLPGVEVEDRIAALVIDSLSVGKHPRRAVWIAPVSQERLQSAGVPVGLDGIVYPFVVGISDPANRDQSDRAELLLCRETIRRSLIHQRLPTRIGASAWAGYVNGYQPLEIVDRAAWAQNVFVSSQIFLVQVNEERGLA